MNDKIFEKKFGYIIEKDKSFKDLTTFKIGGKIKYVVYPKSIKEFVKVLKYLNKNKEKYFIIGGGSNILASDKFFDGVVVSTKRLNKIKVKNKKVFAMCGSSLGAIILESKKHLLSGLEWSIGIPGTCGGASIMNAGAFENEIFDFISFVWVFDGKKILKLKKENIIYGYRTTDLQQNNYVVLKVCFSLLQKSDKEIGKKLDFYIKKRQKTQNITFPSAGSVFKKTQNNMPVSEMIDKIGLKGKQIGGAMISKNHAGFIVNVGGATFEDVKNMIDFILRSVYNIYNINLELEIIIVGEENDSKT